MSADIRFRRRFRPRGSTVPEQGFSFGYGQVARQTICDRLCFVLLLRLTPGTPEVTPSQSKPRVCSDGRNILPDALDNKQVRIFLHVSCAPCPLAAVAATLGGRGGQAAHGTLNFTGATAQDGGRHCHYGSRGVSEMVASIECHPESSRKRCQTGEL